MFKIYAYWSRPRDGEIAAFEAHYLSTHLPRAAAVPHLLRLVTVRCSDGFGSHAHYRVAEMGFASAETLGLAMQSAEWRAMRQCSREMIERFGVAMTVDMGEEQVHALPGEANLA